MRRVFLQAFSPARLRELAPDLVRLAQSYCERWAAAGTCGGPLDISLEVKAFTFEVGRPADSGMADRLPEHMTMADSWR
jgi:cytochrome P450